MPFATVRASSKKLLISAHPLLLSHRAAMGQPLPLLLCDHSSDEIVDACCFFPVATVGYNLQLQCLIIVVTFPWVSICSSHLINLSIVLHNVIRILMDQLAGSQMGSWRSPKLQPEGGHLRFPFPLLKWCSLKREIGGTLVRATFLLSKSLACFLKIPLTLWYPFS
jgi:hypothetical protein